MEVNGGSGGEDNKMRGRRGQRSTWTGSGHGKERNAHEEKREGGPEDGYDEQAVSEEEGQGKEE